MTKQKTLPIISNEIIKGKRFDIDENSPEKAIVYYDHPSGKLYIGDAVNYLKSLDNETVDLVFADPPYNIKKAEWDTFESQQQYVDWSVLWLEQASRVLKPNGSLYVCGFSEILADIKLPAQKYFKGCRWIIWHYRNKGNMGSDWGRSHESLLHFRKSRKFTFNVDDVRIPYGNHTLRYPEHPQAETSQYGNGKKHVWQPNPRGAKPRDVIEIPTINNSMAEKTPHPTQKPEELLRRIILASSNAGDLIIDPFIGSGTTAVVCEQLSRNWVGCDMSREYLDYAIERIEKITIRDKDYWMEYDKSNENRRKSIR